ncbi:MAG: 16S rRNA (uracil(1498)-N(3))-methyltransferase [Sedimentisphaerales bacterium]|nr:16S rRNA (uracil(1498)-N(3))-methyltransferase [Sedimentisphaerales bacterium]
MKRYRFYCSPITTPVARLSTDQTRHAIAVLRLSMGDEVELFDGEGTLAPAVITEVHSSGISLDVGRLEVVPRRMQGRIVIAASIARGDRFDWLISKCTELGVDHICPIIFERTVKLSKNPKAIHRWQNLAIAAAKQCRCLYLPEIGRPTSLPQALESLREIYPHAHFIAGSPDDKVSSLFDQKFSSDDIIAIIGPEGGISPTEETLLLQFNVQPVRLTDTILRIETAAITFAAILTTKRNTSI